MLSNWQTTQAVAGVVVVVTSYNAKLYSPAPTIKLAPPQHVCSVILYISLKIHSTHGLTNFIPLRINHSLHAKQEHEVTPDHSYAVQAHNWQRFYQHTRKPLLLSRFVDKATVVWLTTQQHVLLQSLLVEHPLLRAHTIITCTHNQLLLVKHANFNSVSITKWLKWLGVIRVKRQYSNSMTSHSRNLTPPPSGPCVWGHQPQAYPPPSGPCVSREWHHSARKSSSHRPVCSYGLESLLHTTSGGVSSSAEARYRG